MIRRIVKLLMVVLWFFSLPQASYAQVTIADTGVVEKEIYNEKKDFNYIQKRRTISVKNIGPVDYGFTYIYVDDPIFKENYPNLPFPSIGDSSVGSFGLGLTGGGWYGGGFLGVRVNKKSLINIIAKEIKIVKQGEKGIMDFVWEPECAEIKARFIFLPEDDKVYAEISFAPREEIDALSLNLVSLPGHYGRAKPTARWISTDVRSVSQTDSIISLKSKEEPWILCFDANDNRRGSCAVMYIPEEVMEVQLRIGKLITRTHITLSPKTKKIHLIFWSFPDSYKKPVDAYNYLKENGNKLLEKLREFNFE